MVTAHSTHPFLKRGIPFNGRCARRFEVEPVFFQQPPQFLSPEVKPEAVMAYSIWARIPISFQYCGQIRDKRLETVGKLANVMESEKKGDDMVQSLLVPELFIYEFFREEGVGLEQAVPDGGNIEAVVREGVIRYDLSLVVRPAFSPVPEKRVMDFSWQSIASR